MRKWALMVAAMCLAAGAGRTAAAQALRQSFAAGGPGAAPADWQLEGGHGAWAAGPPGSRYLSVTGTGDDMGYWYRKVPGLRPGAQYRLRFRARVTPGSSASTVIAGLDTCNRDFAVTTDWADYTFVFTTPDDVSGAILRLGQWHLRGSVCFGGIAFAPVQPVYSHSAGAVLGEGETLSPASYACEPQLSGEGSNTARPLVRHTAPFNSNRWVFTGGSDVVYRHSVAGRMQSGGRLTVNVNYRVGGACMVEASADGRAWLEVARLTDVGAREVPLPSRLFPAPAVWVRLRGTDSTDAAGNSQPGGFQVDRYVYRADLTLARAAGRAGVAGQTCYVEVGRQDPRVAFRVDDLGSFGVRPPDAVRLTITPAAGVSGHVATTVVVRQAGRDPAAFSGLTRMVPGRVAHIEVPYRVAVTGPVRVSLLATLMTPASARLCFSAETEGYVPAYYASDYGHPLVTIPEGRLWWCESTYKVSPHREPPIQVLKQPAGRATTVAPGGGLRLYLAGRERGSAQLVLSPSPRAGALSAAATDLVSSGGRRIPAAAIRLREVGYVPVRTPTDRIGAADDWPDPLPPLVGGVWHLVSARNNALWVTVTVPAGTPAGDYDGAVMLRGRSVQRVPVRVHVWGFSLPEHTALRSGFGISPESIARYHNLKTPEARARQWDLYMRDFAAHRLCPYNPMALAPVRVDVVDEPGGPRVRMDFTAFDAAARRLLDGLGMNSFTIGVMGLGAGRYPSYDRGSFLGHPAGTAEYDSLMQQYGTQLQDHLAANGWLDRAYVYWYDEPETADYPFVVDGMERLHRYAPKLKRMLTEEFQAPLYGHVDLWCPITPNYSPGPAHARQALGNEVWWYVCTGPKEPYVGLFIDHPAIEMRMWLWQTWKYRVQGILIWETTYWTSPQQFPTRVQDPWTDPMSYVAGPSGVWGNGDGRFFYPPNHRPNEDTTTEYVAEPIGSMRWELLGEGVSDWEYFHLLDSLVKRAGARAPGSPAVERARRLLNVPDAICRDMTHFTVDPQPLYAHRRKLALAIEEMLRSDRP